MTEQIDTLREQVTAALRKRAAEEGMGDLPSWWFVSFAGSVETVIQPRLDALTAERDDLAMVCDAYGLPHSATALDRHLTGNAALTIETWKATAEGWKARAERAEELAETQEDE